jgi:hypothetical protein
MLQGEEEEETGLSFVQGFISETLANIPGTAGGTDVLVALHAYVSSPILTNADVC